MIYLKNSEFLKHIEKNTLPEEYTVTEDVFFEDKHYKKVNLKKGVFGANIYLGSASFGKIMCDNSMVKGSLFGDDSTIETIQFQKMEIIESMVFDKTNFIKNIWFDDLTLKRNALFGKNVQAAKAYAMWYASGKSLWVDHREL